MFQVVDLWRTIAVLLVVIAHLFIYFGNPVFFIFEPGLLGSTGVAIFFVLTAYVLLFSIKRLDQKNSYSYQIFIIQRVFRIYPIAILFVSIYYIFEIPGKLFNGGFVFEPQTIYSYFSNLLLVENFTLHTPVVDPLWSLPYEFQFYLLLPFLYFYFNKGEYRSKLVFSSLLVIMFSFVFNDKILKLNEMQNILEVPSFSKWWICFVPGIIAYFYRNTFSSIIIKPSTVLILLSFCLLSRMLSYSFFVQFLTAAVVGFTLMCEFKPMNELCKKLCCTVSKYSYGIYLSHFLSIYIAFELTADFYQWPCFILLSFLIPNLCFHLVENPMIKLGKKISIKGLPNKVYNPEV
jgi:peptidoglycan/LPS O-acetylase OafA/YrhL